MNLLSFDLDIGFGRLFRCLFGGRFFRCRFFTHQCLAERTFVVTFFDEDFFTYEFLFFRVFSRGVSLFQFSQLGENAPRGSEKLLHHAAGSLLKLAHGLFGRFFPYVFRKLADSRSSLFIEEVLIDMNAERLIPALYAALSTAATTSSDSTRL